MARRVGWYFIFVGMVLLAVAFVLAVGSQSSGRVLLGGLGSVAAGAWLVTRAGSGAPAAPPPVVQPKAKEGGRPPAPAHAKPPAPAKPAGHPKGWAGVFRPKSKPKT
jgi:hypothetical protein